MKKVVLVWLVLALVIVASCATIAVKELPLPSDAKIVLPIASLPEEIAAFSGQWAMTWDGPLESVLIVEEIGSEKAKITYSWGDCLKKGFYRGTAIVISDGSKVKIEWGDGSKVPKFTFEMRKGF